MLTSQLVHLPKRPTVWWLRASDPSFLPGLALFVPFPGHILQSIEAHRKLRRANGITFVESLMFIGLETGYNR